MLLQSSMSSRSEVFLQHLIRSSRSKYSSTTSSFCYKNIPRINFVFLANNFLYLVSFLFPDFVLSLIRYLLWCLLRFRNNAAYSSGFSVFKSLTLRRRFLWAVLFLLLFPSPSFKEDFLIDRYFIMISFTLFIRWVILIIIYRMFIYILSQSPISFIRFLRIEIDSEAGPINFNYFIWS